MPMHACQLILCMHSLALHVVPSIDPQYIYIINIACVEACCLHVLCKFNYAGFCSTALLKLSTTLSFYADLTQLNLSEEFVCTI